MTSHARNLWNCLLEKSWDGYAVHTEAGYTALSGASEEVLRPARRLLLAASRTVPPHSA